MLQSMHSINSVAKGILLLLLVLVSYHVILQIDQARSDNFNRTTVAEIEYYTPVGEPDSLSILTVILLLKQSATEISILERDIEQISDPVNIKYRKFQDIEAINWKIAPTYREKNELYRWLSSSSVMWRDRGDSIHLNGDVGSLEALLHTRFYYTYDGRLFNSHSMTVPTSVNIVELALIMGEEENNYCVVKNSVNVTVPVIVEKTYNLPHNNISTVYIPDTQLNNLGAYPLLSICIGYTNSIANGYTVSPVIVLPVGYSEEIHSQSNLDNLVMHRTNTELLKLALSGITVVVSISSTYDHKSNTENDKYKENVIIFPASSPWVVSVSATLATEFLSSERVIEQAPQPDTSGAFSSIFSQPWYQTAVVDYYLDTIIPVNYNYVNISNRAYPDVSILGDTSRDAALIFGAALAGLVDRVGNLGLVNPLLYEHAITNPSKWVKAVADSEILKYENNKYWNPVIGLGAPDFMALGDYVLSL